MAPTLPPSYSIQLHTIIITISCRHLWRCLKIVDIMVLQYESAALTLLSCWWVWRMKGARPLHNWMMILRRFGWEAIGTSCTWRSSTEWVATKEEIGWPQACVQAKALYWFSSWCRNHRHLWKKDAAPHVPSWSCLNLIWVEYGSWFHWCCGQCDAQSMNTTPLGTAHCAMDCALTLSMVVPWQATNWEPPSTHTV